MTTTIEKIADLVANGFKLPEGTELLGGDLAIKGDSFTEVDTRQKFAAILLRRQFAYDLIACELARERRAWPQLDYDAYHDAMIRGDTEAAIKAIWEAVRGGKR